MKIMPEINAGSAGTNAGSPDNTQKTGPSAGNEGQPGQDDTKIDRKQYEELEKKLGEQGKELGDFRKIYEGLSPLLDKLDAYPELVQMIMEGKITPELVSAISEGKVEPPEAKTVSQAHDEVKKEVGKDKYEAMKPMEIESLVAAKIEEATKKIKQESNEKDEIRSFEDDLNRFVANTPDFAQYAEAIEQWFEQNPNQTDIRIAYRIVKAEDTERQAIAEAEKRKAEDAKNLAANAGGGASQSSAVIKDANIVDQFIAGKSNPNNF